MADSVTAWLRRDHPNGASLGAIGGIGESVRIPQLPRRHPEWARQRATVNKTDLWELGANWPLYPAAERIRLIGFWTASLVMPSYIVTDDQKPVRMVGSAKGMGGLKVISPFACQSASLRVQPDTTKVEHRSFLP
jgi:hypothetical protein